MKCIPKLYRHLTPNIFTSPIEEKERSTINIFTPFSVFSASSTSPTAAAPPIEYPCTISIS